MNRMTRILAVLTTVTAALISIIAFAFPRAAQATLQKPRSELAWALFSAADAQLPRLRRTTSRERTAVPAAKPSLEWGAAARAAHPVIAAASTAPGQAGYVHYFLLRLPDETLEIQVGIELPDQRIAWSFPGLGVVVSPFIESGVMPASGKNYEVWHLYGVRPFPEDAAMSKLERELPGRIDRWVKAATPYCENDGPRGNCMSCVGFVLRALYPGRNSDYPDLPRDFWRAGSAWRYTPNDLLLYLTGMLDLPTREARLRRIARMTVPDDLRADLEELVYAMGATGSPAAANAGTPQSAAPERPGVRQPARVGIRPTQRKKL
jgi:hypothetical protein